MKIYLDNCCYNRPFDDQTQLIIALESQAKLQIQHEIKNGKHELVSSYMLRFENDQNPFENRKLNTEIFIERYSTEYIGTDKVNEIESTAIGVMESGIKTKDAIHVACAIEAGCDCFLTTDQRLLKYRTDEIKMMNPLDFIKEEEA